MISEKKTANRIERYLVRLGYPKASVTFNVKTLHGQTVALVVYDQDRPRVAIEVKGVGNLPEREDPEVLRFHPYVRQVQSYAKAIGAPYYMLTDGKRFLWFTTDEVGRPRLLSNPVYPTLSKDTLPTHLSKSVIVRVLQELRDMLYGQTGILTSELPATVIYAKLLSERGDDALEQALIHSGLEYDRMYWFLSEELLPSRRLDQRYYREAFEILNRISFSEALPQDLLSAIDEVLISPYVRPSTRLRLPRWLTDFLVRLAQLGPGDVALDIYSNYGDVQAAVLMSNAQASVWTICRDARSVLWAKIQQLAFGHQDDNVIVGSFPPYDVHSSESCPNPTHIVVAPPFGGRIPVPQESWLFAGKTQAHSEELYLELALRWVRPGGRVVMIVPDRLLFARSAETLRRYLLDAAHLSAVISLGASLPQTNIRASVLVLDRVAVSEHYQVFMARVSKTDTQDAFSCHDVPQASSILEAFEGWTETHQIDPNLPIWSTRREDLNFENLTVDRYMPSSLSELDDISAQYPMVPITEIARIRRGSRITLDKGGDLPVIGPAAIRPTMLDVSSLDKTVAEKLGTNPRIVEANDIVVNSISTHRGAAAVVDQDLEGTVVNRHVIIIRPDQSVVLPEYLAIALNSDYVKQQLDRLTTGTVIASLSVRALQEVTIPLPDIETQQEIIDRVSSLRDRWLQAQQQAANAEFKFRKYLQNLGIEEG